MTFSEWKSASNVHPHVCPVASSSEIGLKNQSVLPCLREVNSWQWVCSRESMNYLNVHCAWVCDCVDARSMILAPAGATLETHEFWQLESTKFWVTGPCGQLATGPQSKWVYLQPVLWVITLQKRSGCTLKQHRETGSLQGRQHLWEEGGGCRESEVDGWLALSLDESNRGLGLWELGGATEQVQGYLHQHGQKGE